MVNYSLRVTQPCKQNKSVCQVPCEFFGLPGIGTQPRIESSSWWPGNWQDEPLRGQVFPTRGKSGTVTEVNGPGLRCAFLGEELCP